MRANRYFIFLTATLLHLGKASEPDIQTRIDSKFSLKSPCTQIYSIATVPHDQRRIISAHCEGHMLFYETYSEDLRNLVFLFSTDWNASNNSRQVNVNNLGLIATAGTFVEGQFSNIIGNIDLEQLTVTNKMSVDVLGQQDDDLTFPLLQGGPFCLEHQSYCLLSNTGSSVEAITDSEGKHVYKFDTILRNNNIHLIELPYSHGDLIAASITSNFAVIGMYDQQENYAIQYFDYTNGVDLSSLKFIHGDQITVFGYYPIAFEFDKLKPNLYLLQQTNYFVKIDVYTKDEIVSILFQTSTIGQYPSCMKVQIMRSFHIIGVKEVVQGYIMIIQEEGDQLSVKSKLLDPQLKGVASIIYYPGTKVFYISKRVNDSKDLFILDSNLLCPYGCYDCPQYHDNKWCNPGGCKPDFKEVIFGTNLYCETEIEEDCIDGFYKQEGSQRCLACQLPCLTCEGTASTCLTCATNFKYYESISECICSLDTHEQIILDCAPRPNMCSEEEDGQCIACEGGAVLAEVEGLVSDVCICSRGEYMNVEIDQETGEAIRTCELCHGSCYACTGGTDSDCMSCEDNFYLEGNRCLAACTTEGFYGDKLSDVCLPCDPSCKTCLGKMDSDCITCQDGKRRSDRGVGESSFCVDCPHGTYVDGEECSNCDTIIKGSLKCFVDKNGQVKSSGCKDHLVLRNGTCLCKEGEILDPDSEDGETCIQISTTKINLLTARFQNTLKVLNLDFDQELDGGFDLKTGLSYFISEFENENLEKTEIVPKSVKVQGNRIQIFLNIGNSVNKKNILIEPKFPYQTVPILSKSQLSENTRRNLEEEVKGLMIFTDFPIKGKVDHFTLGIDKQIEILSQVIAWFQTFLIIGVLFSSMYSAVLMIKINQYIRHLKYLNVELPLIVRSILSVSEIKLFKFLPNIFESEEDNCDLHYRFLQENVRCIGINNMGQIFGYILIFVGIKVILMVCYLPFRLLRLFGIIEDQDYGDLLAEEEKETSEEQKSQSLENEFRQHNLDQEPQINNQLDEKKINQGNFAQPNTQSRFRQKEHPTWKMILPFRKVKIKDVISLEKAQKSVAKSCIINVSSMLRNLNYVFKWGFYWASFNSLQFEILFGLFATITFKVKGQIAKQVFSIISLVIFIMNYVGYFYLMLKLFFKFHLPIIRGRWNEMQIRDFEKKNRHLVKIFEFIRSDSLYAIWIWCFIIMKDTFVPFFYYFFVGDLFQQINANLFSNIVVSVLFIIHRPFKSSFDNTITIFIYFNYCWVAASMLGLQYFKQFYTEQTRYLLSGLVDFILVYLIIGANILFGIVKIYMAVRKVVRKVKRSKKLGQIKPFNKNDTKEKEDSVYSETEKLQNNQPESELKESLTHDESKKTAVIQAKNGKKKSKEKFNWSDNKDHDQNIQIMQIIVLFSI